MEQLEVMVKSSQAMPKVHLDMLPPGKLDTGFSI
jgi:hypothetical protein